MGQLNDLIRAAKRATIIEVARKRHAEHVKNSVGKSSWWWHWSSIQATKAAAEAAMIRIQLRRYLRRKGLPTDSPLVPRTPL